MSKKPKKHRTPNIVRYTPVRPRVDALFERHAQGELDVDGLHAGLQALLTEAGPSPLMDLLIKRWQSTPEAERDMFLTLLPRLRQPKVIDYLWQLVKRPRALPIDAKSAVLVILKQMGEDVDLKDPGRYFSPRDITPDSIQSAENLFRVGLRGMARSLRESRDPVEVEAFMQSVSRMPEQAIGGQDILLDLVQGCAADATDLEADFLYALAHTTPFPQVQQAAQQALARLATAGVRPVTPAILGLGQDRFHAAYMTDPQHPWQQSVSVAWERAGAVVQALIFLIDFGYPWRGAIKDMFATRGMSPREFQHDWVEKSTKSMGERQYRVSLARVQATIAAAVEANRTFNIPLPKEYNEIRHLVDRWVLHPSAAALAADSTQDELAHLPLVPDRSDQPLLVDMRDLRRKNLPAGKR